MNRSTLQAPPTPTTTAPGWDTILTEALWIAIAGLALLIRQGGLAHWDPVQSDYLTLVSVLACAAAFVVVIKDFLVPPGWVLLLNGVGVILAVMFVFEMIDGVPSLGPDLPDWSFPPGQQDDQLR